MVEKICFKKLGKDKRLPRPDSRTGFGDLISCSYALGYNTQFFVLVTACGELELVANCLDKISDQLTHTESHEFAVMAPGPDRRYDKTNSIFRFFVLSELLQNQHCCLIRRLSQPVIGLDINLVHWNLLLN